MGFFDELNQKNDPKAATTQAASPSGVGFFDRLNKQNENYDPTVSITPQEEKKGALVKQPVIDIKTGTSSTATAGFREVLPGEGTPGTRRIVTPKIEVGAEAGSLKKAGAAVFNVISGGAENLTNRLIDLFDFSLYQAAREEDKGTDFKTKVLPGDITKKLGAKALSVGVGLAQTAFTPISAELAAGVELPIVKYPAKVVSAAFDALGEAGQWLGGRVIDTLPINEDTRGIFRQPVEELGAIAFPLIAAKTAKPLIGKAGELAKGKGKGIETIVGLTGKAIKIGLEPLQESARIIQSLFKKKINEAQKAGLPIDQETAKMIVNETVKEVPVEVPTVMEIRQSPFELITKNQPTPEPVRITEPIRVYTNQRLVLQNFIKGQEDINYQSVKELGTDRSGNPITARFEWDYKKQKATVYVTSKATAQDLAHELGHYFDAKLSNEINTKLSDVLPDYLRNKTKADGVLASYAIGKLGENASADQINGVVRDLVTKFPAQVEKLAEGETRASRGEKFATALAEVIRNPERAKKEAPEFSDFILANLKGKGLVSERIKKTTEKAVITTESKLIVEKSKIKLTPEQARAEEKFAKLIKENPDKLIADYKKQFGKTLNVDNARELSPDYQGNRAQYSAAVHEPASALIKEMYKRDLEANKDKGNNAVLFTAGGGGSGKTTAIEGIGELNAVAKDAPIIYDSVMAGFKSSKDKIDAAVAAGYKVPIVFVYRPALDAFVDGALVRAEKSGRVVPLEVFIDAHISALDTIKKIAAEYKGNEKVGVSVIDNSLGRGKAKAVGVEFLTDKSYDKAKLTEQLSAALQTQYEQGKISKATYEGTKGIVGAGIGEPSVTARGETIESKQGGPGGEPERTGGRVMGERTFANEVRIGQEQYKGSQPQGYIENAAREHLGIPKSVPKGMEDLFLEARKHKSAEDFANALTTKQQSAYEKLSQADKQIIDKATYLYHNSPKEYTSIQEAADSLGFGKKYKQIRESLNPLIGTDIKNQSQLTEFYNQAVKEPSGAKEVVIEKIVEAPKPEVASFKGKPITTDAFNENKINAPEKVIELLKAVADENNQFSKDRRSTTLQEMKNFSMQYLGDEKLYKNVPAEIRENLGRMKAAQQTMVDLAMEVRADLDKIDTGVATAEEMRPILDKVFQLEAVTKSFSGARTEASHLFSSLRSDVSQGENAIRDLLKDLKKAGTESKTLDEFINKKNEILRPTRADKFWHIYYMSILSGESTQIKNIFGNVTSMFGELAVQGAVNPKGFSQSWAGMMDGLAKGKLKFGEIWKNGAVTKFEEGKVGEPIFTGKVKALSYFSYVGRFMAAVDAYFREGFRGMEARGLAYEQAQNEGYTGDGLLKRTKEIYDNQSEQIIATADRFALRGVYQQKATGLLGAISSGISFMTRKAPPLRFIVPFSRIVANVVNNALDWTPIGFAREGLPKTAIKKISGEPAELSRLQRQELARAVMGTLAMAGFAVMAAEGNLSGNGPTDKKERDILFASGWRPNSVRVGDTWYPYKNWGPLAMGLTLVGNSADSFKYGGLDEKNWVQRTSATLLGSAGSIIDTSFLSGVSNLFDAIANYETSGQAYAQRLISQIATFPVPNLVKQTGRYFDTTIYQANTIKEQVLSDLRITSGLKPKLNVFGEPIKGEALSQLQPVSESKDPVIRFLAANELWVTIPSKATKILPAVGDKRQMTPDEYYEYIKSSGLEIKKELDKRLNYISKIKDHDQQQKYIDGLVDDVRQRIKNQIGRNAQK